jgi:lysozyme
MKPFLSNVVVSSLEDQLHVEEGYSLVAYRDNLGVWTIGIGHVDKSLHAGVTWTPEQVHAAFDEDFAIAREQCMKNCPFVTAWNEPRAAVLEGMFFQMGERKVLQFVNTLAAMARSDWVAAARGMISSKWHDQTPGRVERLAAQLVSGEWHNYQKA